MATWIGADGNYNTAANWNPADVPGDFAGETATFINNGATTAVTVTGTANVIPDGFTFDAGAPTYTITISLSGAGTGFAFFGAGIVNNSSVAQNLLVNTGDLEFQQSSSADNATITVNSSLEFFSNASADDATITINSGVTQFQGSSTADNATITVNAGGVLQFFHTSSGGTARIIANGFLVLHNSSGALSIGSLEGSGGVLASASLGGAATHILTVGSLNTNTTFSGILADDNASLGLTKVGTGTLTLSGANTYTLATTVSAGTLQAGAVNTFSDDSAFTVANGAVLDLNNFSQIIGSLAGVAGASVTLGSGILTAGNASDTTYAGTMSGSGGGLSKVGAGMLTLSGTASYTGATTVDTGTLALSGATSLGDLSGVAANGTFDISGITGTETSIKTLSGNGAVALGAKGLVLTNALSIFSGAISGTNVSEGVELQAGQQVLSGTSTYVGFTTISGGALLVDGTLTTSGTIVDNGGILGGSGTVQSVTVNSGGSLSPGNGPGILTTGNVLFHPGGALLIEINGTTAGTGYDQVSANGSVDLDLGLSGATTLNLFPSINPGSGETFTIISTGLLHGEFQGLPDGATVTAAAGNTFTIDYTLTSVVLTAINDSATAQDDAFTVAENAILSGGASVFLDNGFGADSDPDSTLAVTAVNGAGASVGVPIPLPSGGTLTLNADGTFSYNPNGAFNALPAAGSGASNTTATVTFTYTLTNSDTATVTITIQGVDSDDTLRGTAGDDALTGGIGNDSYFVENSGDAITEGAGQGTLDRVYASVSYVLGAGDSIETMTTTNSLGTGAINLTGNELANTIYGNAGANELNGGEGNDVLAGVGGDDVLNGNGGDDKLYGGAGQNDMAGGTGNDWYIVDSLTDVIIEAAGEGTLDRVFTTLNYTLTAGAHVEILAPTTIFTGAINLTGNQLANTIYGNNNINVLGGAAGNDVLVGLDGTDTLNGGANADTLYGGNDNDILNGDGDADTLYGEAGADTLNGGDGNDNLIGGIGNDDLNGGAGADRLEGGAGQNDLVGGAGDDTYIVSSATDTVTEGTGEGTLDRIYTSVNFALAAGAQVEFLASNNLAGTGALNLTGNAIANTIYGNNGANELSGKGGKDTLTGFGGPDLFVFDTVPNTATNFDTVTDFNGVQDNIRLVKSAFTALTGAAGTTLSADQFVVGAAALDANDRIIYNNGTLSYDSNGNLAGGVQVIAFLVGKPALSNTDIVLA